MERVRPFQFECRELNPQKNYGRFVFSSLGVGDGKTIGNLLRRVLLTNLPGLRIVGVKIAGVTHEFSTIEGIREDVLEILLNLKEIIFKGEKKEVQFGRIKVEGPAIVTASCIDLTQDIEIVNPTHYIATIADQVTLEIGMILDWGKGYTLAENRPIEDPKNYLETDAVFLPVKNIVYNVETSFSESLGTQEELILDLWTDGSLDPSEAMELASETILNWFQKVEKKTISLSFGQPLVLEKSQEALTKNDLLNLYWLLSLGFLNLETLGDGFGETPRFEEVSVSSTESVKDLPIEVLKLSARAQNALKGAQINLVSEIREYSLKDLQKIKHLGQKSVQEIKTTLEKRYKIFLE